MTSLYTLIFALVTTLVGLGNTCSPGPWRPQESNTEKILRSNRALYGRIIRHYPHPTPMQTDAYTAEMEVYCSLKGEQTDPVVNLTEAGYVAAMCHSSRLLVDGTYIALVRENLEVNQWQIDITNTTVSEVMKACGLAPVYPKGVDPANVSPEKACIISSPSPSNCLKLDLFTKENDYGAKELEMFGKQEDAGQHEGRSCASANIVTVWILMISSYFLLLPKYSKF